MGGLIETLGGSFLAPAGFAFLALIPVVVILYLLKLRRTRVIVSSTLLWRKSLQDLTANAPFQRLRKNLLLLLQILVLGLLATALARPFVKAGVAGGNDICLLFDRSASMQAVEDGQTRLDAARQLALEMVDDMAGGDKMMVVTFANGSDVLCELTDNRVRLREAIRGIEAADTSTRVRDGIMVASSLQAGMPNLRTVVLSDGRISDLEDIGARAFDISFLRVGKTSRNAGIVAFSVRDPAEGEGDRQCLVAVYNDAEDPLDTTLTLFLDDQSAAVEEINVLPKSTAEVVFALPSVDAGVLRAELDVSDALTVDNTAWLTLRPPGQVRVLLVAKGDSTSAYFLKRVLALSPRVELSAVAPESYTGGLDSDLVIFDSFSPPEQPETAALYFNALPPVEGLASEGTLDNPPIIATDPGHPAMRFLNPGNVVVSKALKLALPDGARPLISTQGGALVADVSRGGRQALVVAFDLADSNWPLRLSFPLFIQNVITWIPASSASSEMSVSTGEPITILPDPQATTATVSLPDGRSEPIELVPTRPNYFADTARAGVYTVACGASRQEYALNLLDPVESAIAPAESLSVGRSEVPARARVAQQNRELWHWFALAALAVLGLEWWIYSRRAWL